MATLAGLGWTRLRRRAELRAAWGHPGDKDAWLASRYFDLTCAAAPAGVVDDRTWADLEFPRFFSRLDTTITPAGRQYLFSQLRRYEFDEAVISGRHRLYAALRADPELRERIQLALTPMDRDDAAYVADILWGPLEPVRHHALIVPWVLLTLAAVAGVAVHVVPVWLGAALLLFNAILSMKIHPWLERKAHAVASCRGFLDVAKKLASILQKAAPAAVTGLDGLAAAHRQLSSHMRVMAVLDALRDIVFVGGLVIILNALFLLRLAVYAHSVRKFVHHRAQWREVFELAGQVDAAVAIASFLHRHPGHCRPVVSAEAVISIANGCHPLLPAPVPNSITLAGRSALVTGSNMAGKTTFVKMVAMNVILGHTLGICLAERATIPRSAVMALIRGEQSVESGKSRYFAEVEAIRDFISQAEAGIARIFVLDEPFSGTNTIERIGAAQAVLGAIAAHAQVLVTTHDVELQQLLAADFDLFHFQEDPAVEGFFDYRLRTGAGTQRNAIKVLERLGFPADIIARALAATGGVT